MFCKKGIAEYKQQSNLFVLRQIPPREGANHIRNCLHVWKYSVALTTFWTMISIFFFIFLESPSWASRNSSTPSKPHLMIWSLIYQGGETHWQPMRVEKGAQQKIWDYWPVCHTCHFCKGKALMPDIFCWFDQPLSGHCNRTWRKTSNVDAIMNL